MFVMRNPRHIDPQPRLAVVAVCVRVTAGMGGHLDATSESKQWLYANGSDSRTVDPEEDAGF